MNGVSVAAQLNNPKTVRAWYMFDWANSVYSLVITSAIFPVYYKAIAVTKTGDVTSDEISFLGMNVNNSVLYSYALSFSFLLVAAMLPLLSGVADYTGRKKLFMKIFVFVGSLSCFGLYFFDSMDMLVWGIFFSVTASIGYSGSLVFYDAFLPEIVTEEKYDITSAKGYSMGYYGSVIMMIICLFVIMNYEIFGVFKDSGAATRFSFLLVGIWWLGFSSITFRLLPENGNFSKSKPRIWAKGYEELVKVWRSLKQSPDLKRFLLSFFFYNMGVQTVMYLASLFGQDELKLPSERLIITILLIQIVGAWGAWFFARVSKRSGNKFTLQIMITLWMCVCVIAYFITEEYQFYLLAVLVGTIMGGIQSLSRASYSKLIPQNTIAHASYFSFYDVTYNLSIVMGTFSYGFIDHITGTMRNSVLALGVYFVIGFMLLFAVKSTAITRKTM